MPGNSAPGYSPGESTLPIDWGALVEQARAKNGSTSATDTGTVWSADQQRIADLEARIAQLEAELGRQTGTNQSFDDYFLDQAPSEQEVIAGAISDPAYFQNIYEQALNLPAEGRSFIQRYLASLGPRTAAQYQLERGLYPNLPEQSFGQYLTARDNRPVVDLAPRLYRDLMALDPMAQRTMFGRMRLSGAEALALQREAFLGAQRETQPRWMAQGITAQAFTPEQYRAYQLNPQRLAEGGDTFLNYLMRSGGF